MASDRETSALKRAHGRRELRLAVEQVIARGLDRDACRDVLADLLVELSEDGEQAHRSPVRANGVVPDATPNPRVTRRRIGKAGRPIGTTAKSGRGPTRQLLAILAEHPRAPIKELARLAFGADGKYEQTRTRTVLTAQKKIGTVRNVGTGKWEVVTAGS